MVRRSGFWFRLLAVILLLGGLAVVGTMLYRAGQAQGYAMGVAASAGESPAPQGSQVAPFYPYGYMRPYYPPFWSPFGFLFGIFAFFLFFWLIGGLFRFLFWGRLWMGPGRHGWRHHHQHPWGNPPGEQKPEEPVSS